MYGGPSIQVQYYSIEVRLCQGQKSRKSRVTRKLQYTTTWYIYKHSDKCCRSLEDEAIYFLPTLSGESFKECDVEGWPLGVSRSFLDREGRKCSPGRKGGHREAWSPEREIPEDESIWYKECEGKRLLSSYVKSEVQEKNHLLFTDCPSPAFNYIINYITL